MFIYLILTLIFLLGGIIQGATSFGFSIFAMAALPFFVPYKTSIVLVSFVGFALAARNAFLLRAHIDIKQVLIPLSTAMIGRTIGTRQLMNWDGHLLEVILGVVLILFAIYFTFLNDKIKIKPTFLNGSLAGLMSGVLGGLFIPRAPARWSIIFPP